MSQLSSLYWIARCDGCGKPITAHGMSVLREAMLCLHCLEAEAQAMAHEREAGRAISFAREPVRPRALPAALAPVHAPSLPLR